MDARTAFRVGFLMRCADEGLSPEQTAERIKCAAEKTALSLKDLWSAASLPFKAPGAAAGGAVGASVGGGSAVVPGAVAGHFLWNHPGTIALTAAGLPLAAGGLAGWAAAKSRSDPLALPTANAEELVTEYRRLSDQEARRQLASKREKAMRGLARIYPAGMR